MSGQWFEGIFDQAEMMIEEFGENFEHLPHAYATINGEEDVNARKVVDTTRTRQTLTGAFTDEHEYINKGFKESSINSSDPCVAFRQCDLEETPVCKKDLLRRCASGKIYEVVDIQPDAWGIVEMKLLEQSRRV